MRFRRLPASRTIAVWAVLIALAAAWFVLLRPQSLGGTTGYIMVAGDSMEPTFHGGDLAIVQRKDHYGVGDIVAFRADGGIVVHRIVGGSAESGFDTRGDNRKLPDGWRPGPEHIVGKVWFHIPAGGRAVGVLQDPLVLGVLAGALVFVTVLRGGQRPRPASAGATRQPTAGGLVGGLRARAAARFRPPLPGHPTGMRMKPNRPASSPTSRGAVLRTIRPDDSPLPEVRPGSLPAADRRDGGRRGRRSDAA
jgi:signal peptidase I